jgi:hypothetical protein
VADCAVRYSSTVVVDVYRSESELNAQGCPTGQQALRFVLFLPFILLGERNASRDVSSTGMVFV